MTDNIKVSTRWLVSKCYNLTNWSEALSCGINYWKRSTSVGVTIYDSIVIIL